MNIVAEMKGSTLDMYLIVISTLWYCFYLWCNSFQLSWGGAVPWGCRINGVCSQNVAECLPLFLPYNIHKRFQILNGLLLQKGGYNVHANRLVKCFNNTTFNHQQSLRSEQQQQHLHVSTLQGLLVLAT